MKPQKGSLLDILLDIADLQIDVETAKIKIMGMLNMDEPTPIMVKQSKPKRQRSVESYMIANCKTGEYFFTDKADGHLTAYAFSHGRKIKTERVVVISGNMSEPKMESKTKCIIL